MNLRERHTEAHAATLDTIERARAGDRDAFARIYRAWGPTVHGIILASVPRIEVDDIVQDVFTVALAHLAELREPSAFGAWLARIARNRATTAAQSTASHELVEEPPARATLPDSDALAVLATIRELPVAYRETLVLRLVEGMTGPEIALRMGMSPGSVRVNLCRGMKLLRARLGAPEEAG